MAGERVKQWAWKNGTPDHIWNSRLGHQTKPTGVYIFVNRHGDMAVATVEYRNRADGHGTMLAIDVEGDVRELKTPTDFEEACGIGEIWKYFGPVQKPKVEVLPR